MFLFFSFLLLIAIGALAVWKHQYNNATTQKLATAKAQGEHQNNLEAYRAARTFPVPGFANYALVMLFVGALGFGIWDKVFFYAEPGYIYHVRTITGQENVVDSVGYNMYLFGRVSPWKKAVTIQADTIEDDVRGNVDEAGDEELNQAEATMKALNIVFLDQVDADVSATARFRIPIDRETFLIMAHEYRTPANLMRTALVPAFKETLQATASLMTAEDYYSGARTQFNNEFEKQLSEGVYVVNREEIVVRRRDQTSASANASLGTKQQVGIDETQIEVIVEKTGAIKRQKFLDFGITLVEGRVTEMQPNSEFSNRMKLKQKASADRAIAREQKIQEVEQKLLAEARGEREVAQKQAEAKVRQIELTTNAETDKQLALTAASKQLEQARIDKETSQVRLEQSRLDAEKQKTLADAESYEKRVLLEADNALAAKLATEIEVQTVWAKAFAERSTPTTVFITGGSSDGATPTGSNLELQQMLQLMTMQMAERLNYNRATAPSN